MHRPPHRHVPCHCSARHVLVGGEGTGPISWGPVAVSVPRLLSRLLRRSPRGPAMCPWIRRCRLSPRLSFAVFVPSSTRRRMNSPLRPRACSPLSDAVVTIGQLPGRGWPYQPSPCSSRSPVFCPRRPLFLGVAVPDVPTDRCSRAVCACRLAMYASGCCRFR